MENYCELCGGTETNFQGEVCSCVIEQDPFSKYEFQERVCSFIPESYRGLYFLKQLVATFMPEEYANMLQSYYDAIQSEKMKCKNILISSPIGTSKTIWVYTLLELLARRKLEVAPYLDLYEIKRALSSFDKNLEGMEIKTTSLYLAPYLFVRIPLDLNKYIFNTIETILDRRVRRGLSTIFTYQGNIQSLSGLDEHGMLTGLRGDGSLRTIKIEQYFRK